MGHQSQSEILTPAFWDLHIHGVAGIDFLHATTDEMAEACRILGRNGIGVFSPTLLTAEPGLFERACRRWGDFLDRLAGTGAAKRLPPGSALPLGLHLEGPFLSPMMAGAHPRAHLRNPSLAAAERALELALGRIAIVTLAPELPGAPRLIRMLNRKGVRVQIGHTSADTRTLERACRCGASGATHLYNAMRIHHREPGVLKPLLEGRLTAEIITDGVHLDPFFLRFLIQALGPRLYAVSDACAALGRPASRACSTLGSLPVRRRGPVAYVKGIKGQPSILAGGATWLTSHPERLFRAWHEDGGSPPAPNMVFPLFHRIPSLLFPKHARMIRETRLRFSRKDWRFQGVAS